jgi:RNA polymerase sigma-70 factor (ECF subfamily)
MTATTDVFELHRSRLLGIACRMLGSRNDAEDLLQDAYMRWHESNQADIQCAVAFLISITTRLCLDRLRHLKHERARGLAEAWSSEELVACSHSAPSPEMLRECSEEVLLALAAVFDRLGRDERSAFLLHDIFDYDYPELARMLGKTEPTCRQIVHRARKRLRESKPRAPSMIESRESLLGRLLHAVRSGDRQAALSLIGAEVAYAD